MKLSNLNEWLTLMANFGVLASIIFLAMELRLNTEMTQAQTRDAITQKQLDMYDLLIGSIDANDVYHRGRLNLELSDEEATRFQIMAISVFRIWENEWYQYQKGLFEDYEFEPRKQVWFDYFTGNPGIANIWEEVKDGFSEDFRNALDDTVSSSQLN